MPRRGQTGKDLGEQHPGRGNSTQGSPAVHCARTGEVSGESLGIVFAFIWFLAGMTLGAANLTHLHEVHTYLHRVSVTGTKQSCLLGCCFLLQMASQLFDRNPVLTERQRQARVLFSVPRPDVLVALQMADSHVPRTGTIALPVQVQRFRVASLWTQTFFENLQNLTVLLAG